MSRSGKVKQPRRLNKQQLRFVEACAAGDAHWLAAWKAGYCNSVPSVEPSKEKKAQLRSQASRLYANPRIAEAIEQWRSEMRSQRSRTQAVDELSRQVGVQVGTIYRAFGLATWSMFKTLISGPPAGHRLSLRAPRPPQGN